MDLRQLLNVAYSYVPDWWDDERREQLDRQLDGLSAPPSRRAREGQAQLMGAMELGRR